MPTEAELAALQDHLEGAVMQELIAESEAAQEAEGKRKKRRHGKRGKRKKKGPVVREGFHLMLTGEDDAATEVAKAVDTAAQFERDHLFGGRVERVPVTQVMKRSQTRRGAPARIFAPVRQ